MGLICERMSDYDKLVKILRSYSTEVISYKIDGAFAYAVTAAADAIEQLGKDNAVLTKERDAAVADIQPVCGCCKWLRDYGDVAGCFCPKPCRNISGVNTMWEWRGVQEENGPEI